MSDLYGCVSDGVVCSSHGSCIDHSCTCDDGYEGTYCESTINNSSSSDTGIIIGVVLGNSQTSDLQCYMLIELLLGKRCYYTSLGDYPGAGDYCHVHLENEEKKKGRELGNR